MIKNLSIPEIFENVEAYSGKDTVYITDANVYEFYKGYIPIEKTIVIPAGEQFKNLETVKIILDTLLSRNASRETILIGVGGGVVTDITGFVASIYMRGIKFGFISTTLLGMVDASIGGKNGVNLDGYKNIVGTFNQPEFIYWSTEFLKTLPKQEIANGFGEILKYAIGFNKYLFDDLYIDDMDIIMKNDRLVQSIILSCQNIKKDLVLDDPKEHFERKKLNLGHTIAHAIEKHTNGKISHGYAVGMGLHYIAQYSLQMGFINAAKFEKISKVLEDYGFHRNDELVNASLEHIVHDKKANGDAIDLVVLKDIGECDILRIETKTLMI